MAITTLPRHSAPARPAQRRRTAAGNRLRRNLTGARLPHRRRALLLVFSWYPMVREFIMAFQRTRRGTTTWVGSTNFERIVNDPAFWQAWRNTIYFTVLALVLGFAVPFFVAILLNELRHAQAYLRILVYLPVMLPPVASVLLFKYFYDPGYGLFNAILKALHLPTRCGSTRPTPRCSRWSSRPPG